MSKVIIVLALLFALCSSACTEKLKCVGKDAECGLKDGTYRACKAENQRCLTDKCTEVDLLNKDCSSATDCMNDHRGLTCVTGKDAKKTCRWMLGVDDACQVADECDTGICKDGKCAVLGLNANCTDYNTAMHACGHALKCNMTMEGTQVNWTCVDKPKVGDACNRTAGQLCGFNSDCVDGKCVEFFTVDKDGKCAAMSCKANFYCKKASASDFEGVCTATPAKLYSKCKEDKDCGDDLVCSCESYRDICVHKANAANFADMLSSKCATEYKAIYDCAVQNKLADVKLTIGMSTEMNYYKKCGAKVEAYKNCYAKAYPGGCASGFGILKAFIPMLLAIFFFLF